MTISIQPDNRTEKQQSPAPRRGAFGGRRLPVVKALSLLGSMTLATGGLLTVSSVFVSSANASPALCGVPTGSGLQQNINTSLGCNVVDGTSLMSGYISDTGLQPGQVLTLEDAYEGLASHTFYYGNYTLVLGCLSGTASPATSNYVIAPGSGSYPLTPPTITGGSLPQVTADSGGNVICTWALSVQYQPSGQLNSSKSDLWVISGGSGNVATASVKPPVLVSSDPTTTVAPTTTLDPTTTVAPTTTVDPTTTTVAPTTTVDPTTTTVAPTTTVDPTTTTVAPTTTVDPTTTTVAPTTVPVDRGTTAPTTAPVLQTATVSDPSNGPTSSYIPPATDPATNDPAHVSTPGGSPTTGDPVSTTSAPHTVSALAFTGSMSEELAAIGLMLILAGGLVLGSSRRWIRSRS